MIVLLQTKYINSESRIDFLDTDLTTQSFDRAIIDILLRHLADVNFQDAIQIYFRKIIDDEAR